MSTAYLLIGGNLGDRLAYLQQAAVLIGYSCGKIVLSSAIYETAAWGIIHQPAFYNQAIAIQTTMDPEQLMQELLHIEESMGRERVIKMGPRIIDLDILLIDDKIISTRILTLPHPALQTRRFALVPLCEIAPSLVHPVLHQPISELLTVCEDGSDVQKKSAGPD